MNGRHGKKVIIWILLMLAICMMIFSGCKLWEIRQVYAEGDQSYETLAETVRQFGGTESQKEKSAALTAEEPQVEMPDITIDFGALRAVNPDAAAWLYCPGTVIDYPVMRADDYDWYLRHLPDGTYNANGTLFLDYNASADFSGRLSVIYGHNMKSGRMFGSLTKYKAQEYYEEHPYLYLYTPEGGNYRIDILYGCVVSAGEWRERAFVYEENLSALLIYAAHNTTFENSAEYTEEDRFIVLSTCSYEFDDARYVVIGKLEPEYAG